MKLRLARFVGVALVLAGCATPPVAPPPAPATPQAAAPAAPIEVQVLAINDFHGHLEPPKLSIEAGTRGASLRVPAGGVAYMATAAKTLRAGHPQSVTVSAGDMIG